MFLLPVSFAFAGAFTASSLLKDPAGVAHPADAAFDGLLAEGWGEGEMGPGVGSWVEIDLGTATKLDSVSIWPGNLTEGAKSYREYGRPKLIKVLVDGVQQGEPVRLQDELQRLDVAVDVTGKKVRIQVDDVFEGMVFADLFIAEVAVNFSDGERARAVEKVETWRTGKEGQRYAQKYDEDTLAAYTTHKEDPDDFPSLQFLMAAAGDGPEFLRKRVTSLVPAGYRAAAIVPDDMAMKAIRKLRDPNGIPGLEMAALRAIGKQQREIRDVIDYFYAWQDLSGGGRRNIKAWGERGFEVGALQSFDEPLAIEIDTDGNAWIADTGNNRIQRFNPNGISDVQWGAPKDVSQAWYGDNRKWYAAGSGAGADSGTFTNPIDIEVIPGKDGDQFITLDALGKLQIWDAEGRVLIGWSVRVDDQVQPHVGGEGYLAYLPKQKRILVFLGNDAVVFDTKSEELGRWEVKDGTPNAVEVGPDSRLYMMFGHNVIAYNPDGFRYGTVIDERILGEGFEDCDLTFDEKGSMWALTDKGMALKFKKPGKLDWKQEVSEVELVHPRFAVRQGQVLLTDRDRIVPIDVLQLHTDAVEAEKAEAEERKGKK